MSLIIDQDHGFAAHAGAYVVCYADAPVMPRAPDFTPPIPEPSVWLLMLAGVALVALVARRHQGRTLNLFDTRWMRDR